MYSEGNMCSKLPGPASHDQPCAVFDWPETADLHRSLDGHHGLLDHDECQALDERQSKGPSSMLFSCLPFNG